MDESANKPTSWRWAVFASVLVMLILILGWLQTLLKPDTPAAGVLALQDFQCTKTSGQPELKMVFKNVGQVSVKNAKAYARIGNEWVSAWIDQSEMPPGSYGEAKAFGSDGSAEKCELERVQSGDGTEIKLVSQ